MDRLHLKDAWKRKGTWKSCFDQRITHIFCQMRYCGGEIESGGPVVENPPANASGRPWSAKIPHAPGQLSLSAATAEPTVCNKRSHHKQKLTHCKEEWSPLTATRESPHPALKTQHSHK